MPYLNFAGAPMPESASPTQSVFGTSAGGETLTAPPGPSSVDGNGGGDVFIGSNGDNIFYVKDPHDVVEIPAGATGVKTVVAFTSFILPDGVQNLTSSGQYNFAAGNSLDNLIIVGADAEDLYGGPGNDVLVGGSGNNSFIVRAGEGSDVIYGWHTGDTVRLDTPTLNTFAQVQAAMTQVGADVSIQIDPTEKLIIRNTQVGQFTAHDFLLPLDKSQLGAMTFDDEFTSFSTYDFTTKTGTWRTDFGAGKFNADNFFLPANGELQDYVTSSFTGTGTQPLGYNPFSLENGVLTITAQPFAQQDLPFTFGQTYASGMINTRGVFEQKYGYFEIRMALPTAQGSWPAFWMVPDNNPTGSTEADISENLAINPHIDFVRGWGGDPLFANALKPGDPSGFHTYGMLWTASTVTFFYDGVAVLSGPTPQDWTAPMYMIVNFAIGGFGGAPNPAQFPDSLKIDYVRAWALADGSTQVVHGTPDPPAGDTAPANGGATAGDDNLVASASLTQIHAGAGNDTITGWSGGDYLRGDDGNDSIQGGSGFDDINGNKGNDTIDGGSGGADWLVGGQSDDLIIAHASNNILYGNLGNDTLLGGADADLIRGGQGDDSINGGGGADWISGDRGNDTIAGGPGADTFHTFSGAGIDRVIDFNVAEGDRVQLDPGTSYTVSQVGADVVIDMGNGDEMILQNVQLSSLPANWIFAA